MSLEVHPSDNAARWNSTQHPTWPRALSEEHDPAANNWYCGVLVSVDIEENLKKSMQRKHSFWSGRISEFSMRRRTVWCWVEIISNHHLLSISTQHPDEKYGYDISLSGVYHDFISHLLKLNCNYGGYGWLKPRKTNPRLLTGNPWLATYRPAMMDAGWNSTQHYYLKGVVGLENFRGLIWNSGYLLVVHSTVLVPPTWTPYRRF